MLAMSSEWGRIDEAGTVFVKTADGEREVGSWQAGDAEAGLAYYIRRFDDLQTEVDLLAKRLESGAGDAKATKSQAMTLHASLPTVAAVGDLASLDTRLVALITAADAKMGEQAEAREAARAEAIAKKEALAAEAETIAESLHPVEGRRRPAAHHRRGVEADQGHRPQDRRRAVEAVRRRPGRLRQAARQPLRPPRHRARRRQGDQGEAGRPGRGAVRVGGLARDRGGAEGTDDRVEGRSAHQPQHRGRAVEAVPGRPGRLLRAALRGVRRARRRAGPRT